jgi:hypothetical protein
MARFVTTGEEEAGVGERWRSPDRADRNERPV